ncbi:MAG: AzlD domain-containing protein [Eubacteriales bacterium]|nr:AzlD domain-containing protein [Eubacteriales bacterium]
MNRNVYVYIFIMFAVTYLIRMLPLTLIRKPIRNRFIRSFLYYVPYVTLAVMTFPDIVNATTVPLAGLLALIAGAALAWSGRSLFTVAVLSCAVVFVSELFL